MALVVASGCRRRSEPEKGKLDTLAAAASPPINEAAWSDEPPPPAPRPKGPPPRCRAPHQSGTFLIRGAHDVDGGDDGGVDQPFAVELGGAAVLSSGFAVTALRHDASQTEAVVALLDRDATRGQVVALGRVFGSAEPPKLVAHGDRVFVAVVDADASGPTLRLARFDAAAPQASLAWGADVQQGRDESSAFSLALSASGTSGLLAWDDYDVSHRRSVVRVARFATESWGQAVTPRNLSSGDEDAEAPLIVPRKGGYWAAWLAPAASAREPPVAEPPQGEEDEELALVDAAPSQLRVAVLDESGTLLGEPHSVTPPASQVVVFDLAAPGDGSSALLAWRDEKRALGGQGAALRVASVSLDGTVQEHDVDATALGAGMPTLLSDESAREGGAAAVWLAAMGTEAEHYLGLVNPAGIESFYAEPALATKQALVAGHGGLLFAQPRGRDLVVGSVRCSLSPPEGEAQKGAAPNAEPVQSGVPRQEEED